MVKPNCNDSQLFDRTPSPTSMLPPPPPPPSADFNMNWHTSSSQSDPSIQSRQNQFINRSSTTAYKVSIGHETVNITEIARRQKPSSDPPSTVISNEQRRIIASQKGANILSLCFMCFVSASLILIAISLMHLLLKSNYVNNNDIIPFFLQSTNFTPGFIYIFAKPISSADKISHFMIPMYDRTIRDLATIICLLIIVLNCFCLLVFSIEIYLGSNMIKTKQNLHGKCSFIFSSSTSRFIAICSFYASIPSLILVMCLFILLNMSLIPAIISLVVLGFGLIFILITLLIYFSSWQNQNISTRNEKSTGLNSSIHHPIDTNLLDDDDDDDDDINLAKADELSTLV